MKTNYINENMHVLGSPNMIRGFAIEFINAIKKIYEDAKNDCKSLSDFRNVIEKGNGSDAFYGFPIYRLGVRGEFNGVDFDLMLYSGYDDNMDDKIALTRENAIYIPEKSNFMRDILAAVFHEDSVSSVAVGDLCKAIEMSLVEMNPSNDEVKEVEIYRSSINTKRILDGVYGDALANEVTMFGSECSRGISDSEFSEWCVEMLKKIHKSDTTSDSNNIQFTINRIVNTFPKVFENPNIVYELFDNLKYYIIDWAILIGRNGTVGQSSVKRTSNVICKRLSGYQLVDFLKSVKIIMLRFLQMESEPSDDVIECILKMAYFGYACVSRSSTGNGAIGTGALSANDKYEGTVRVRAYDVKDGEITSDVIELDCDCDVKYISITKNNTFSRSMSKTIREYYLNNNGDKAMLSGYVNSSNELNGDFIKDVAVIGDMIKHLSMMITEFVNSVNRNKKLFNAMSDVNKKIYRLALSAVYDENGNV